MAAQLAELESMKSDSDLKKEMEFESKLRHLLGEYGYSLKDVIKLLDPQAGRRAPAVESKVGSRKPPEVKVYKNPHTGEVVETKGGNHRTLKEWKAEYGSATVESWLTK
ncbi:transcriptional regulator [Pseudomonas sp. FW306-02-F02-AA]|uniref:Transcriptional regulator n=1 Tax=Pseudomonas fluorescens TaxID=294 RepID=A0A0N7H177_PSEFL|nr:MULTISPECIES: histone-like nucleoid-structuring protein, MvaT/MvaU family [Pseudomonas]ALI05172.1 transcriptional regulator [Pseudomonas fluorescens]PMZ03308.1 transcriptional regulator [Pseudomonas sp. FW306-02-F02-AB]PMZ07820.1 transcriptional regulator [Pseudomonas sp. FW306-02-H06C]PMZ13534.1 transcriptional regulator [Pseudomonas sp. FW306-02-F02-AA]PMZ19735.1 transcriptional regulator [Pseudomonas sp. FW306-02-F08-AA]